jgi:capsular exopolysaccharide synthesis family protein
MNRSIDNIEDAKLLLDIPILGTVPLMTEVENKTIGVGNQNSHLLDSSYKSSYAVTNSFEIIQTNLSFSLLGKKSPVILVTSATQGEGKSFTAANLAKVMAARGMRVLLIDADMRRPSQHTIWQTFNIKGLSNVLINETSLENSILHPLPNLDLDVVTAGTLPPNPIALLDSHSMDDFVKKARDNYDFVIIDTPPLMYVADPLVVSKFVDGILLVVRLGKVDSQEVVMSKSLLDQSKVPVLGMILNGISEQSSYGGHYYGRDYYSASN